MLAMREIPPPRCISLFLHLIHIFLQPSVCWDLRDQSFVSFPPGCSNMAHHPSEGVFMASNVSHFRPLAFCLPLLCTFLWYRCRATTRVRRRLCVCSRAHATLLAAISAISVSFTWVAWRQFAFFFLESFAVIQPGAYLLLLLAFFIASSDASAFDTVGLA